MIEAASLTKRFGAFTAIEDVTFSVAPGEIVGFLGPNGAGKSTTMRILTGVFPPTSGRAVVAGHDVVQQSLEARRRVGYFPERVALYADMTVREYLRYVAEIKGLDRSRRAAAVDDALASCNLERVAHRIVGNLSKGFRQRVGIAQALVGDPEVLILDEPTSGLDPEQVADMRERIAALRGRRTVILSTHILSEVEQTCDRVIILNRGRVVAVDTPANLNRRLRPTSQIHLELAGESVDVDVALAELPGILAVRRVVSRHVGTAAWEVDFFNDAASTEIYTSVVVGSGGQLLELRPVALSLEDIFLNLVAESVSDA